MEKRKIEKKRTIIISISNNTSVSYGNINLLDEKNFPTALNVSIKIYDEDEFIYETTLKKFTQYIEVNPFYAYILDSTNNRQLNFYATNAYGITRPIEPSMETPLIGRKEIQDEFGNWEYVFPWDASKWNIADTAETFLLSNGLIFSININAFQLFEIKIRHINHSHKKLGIYKNLS